MNSPHATDMPEDLAARLTAAYRDHDPHRRAAVELLVWAPARSPRPRPLLGAPAATGPTPVAAPPLGRRPGPLAGEYR